MNDPALFVSALIATFAHLVFTITRPQINIFYSFALMRGCVSMLRSYASYSAFANLYNRAIMLETLIVDFYFMIQTGTLYSAGWPIGVGLGMYLLATLIINHRREDPFTDLLYCMAHAAFTAAHIIIILEF